MNAEIGPAIVVYGTAFIATPYFIIRFAARICFCSGKILPADTNKSFCFAAIKRFAVIGTVDARDLPETGKNALTALVIEINQYFFDVFPELIRICPDAFFILFAANGWLFLYVG